MYVSDVKLVKPAKDNVIIETVELTPEGDLYFAKDETRDDKNAELSFGKVLSLGPRASEETACPGVVEGDDVVFNRYAGSHVATKDSNKIVKVMIGYNIMAKLGDINNLNEDNVWPSSNRLLLKVRFVDQDENGLVFDENIKSSDPRLEDLDYGEVIKVGPSCKLGYEVGDIVAYNVYAGENVRRATSLESPALRVLNEEDVLLTI